MARPLIDTRSPEIRELGKGYLRRGLGASDKHEYYYIQGIMGYIGSRSILLLDIYID